MSIIAAVAVAVGVTVIVVVTGVALCKIHDSSSCNVRKDLTDEEAAIEYYRAVVIRARNQR